MRKNRGREDEIFWELSTPKLFEKKKKTLKGDISEIKGGIGYCRSMEMVKLFLRE